MEIDSGCDKDFDVLELDKSMDNDDFMDENDNYKYKQTKFGQPVDPTSLNLGIDQQFCNDTEITSEVKRELDSQKHDTRKRQTKLAEYFAVIPPETFVEHTPDNSSEKMVNVSLLLSQLFNARVVIDRLPDYKIVKTKPLSKKLGVQRYCHSCKTLNVDHTNLTTRKSCSTCNKILLYVCEKCNEKYYKNYKHCRRHESRCTGKKTRKSLDDILMFYCSECPFETPYWHLIEGHVQRTSHKVLENREIKTNQTLENPLKFIVKLNDIDWTNVKKLYCPNCEKIVANCTVKRGKICDTCNSILLYQCTKCDEQFNSHYRIMKHLKSTCYASVYRCPNCNHSTTTWNYMRAHLKQSCKSLPKNCRIRQPFGKFMCEHCSFRTDRKRSIFLHLFKYHVD